MADLTADAPLRIWGEAHTERFHCDSSETQTIYKGQPLILLGTADTLYAQGFVDADTVAATDVFLGIAAEKHVVTSGDSETNEASYIEAYVEPTIVGFKSTVFDNANLGDPVYMSDSGTLSTTIGDNPCIGKVHRVQDGYVFVRLISPYVCAGA